ncbi:uncharacterized protein METZ01_LOCUS136256, partial [marine metagenome]
PNNQPPVTVNTHGLSCATSATLMRKSAHLSAAGSPSLMNNRLKETLMKP